MFPRIALGLCAFLVVGWLSADEPKKPVKEKSPLAEAQKRLLHGNYAEAREEFESVAKADAKLAPQAAVGIAETYRLVGQSEKSLEIIDAALKVSPKSAVLLAARGDLLLDSGKWDDAEKETDAALALDKNNLLARWTKGRLLRERGKLEEAREAFRWMVKFYNDADLTDPADLLLISEGAAEFARWMNNSKQFSFILNTVIKDALKDNPEYWPAELLAGNLLLEKYNRPDAVEAYDNVLKTNPKAADALVGKAQASLVKFDLKDADAFADQAIKINPNQRAALAIKAEVLSVAGDYPAAEAYLLRAAKSNPRDSVILGKLGAMALLQNKKSDFEKLEKEVAAYDAKPGVFYAEVAATLEERKRYEQAEGFYKKAAELRPMLAGPRTGLGMLYLRLGNEPEGRKFLDAAFKVDPFNVRVSNSRKVLAHLDNYKTIETDHYILRFDPKTDQVLGNWLADYLEETHADLKKQFNYEFPGKMLIEVFNSHEMFSGRTVGLPDLHTIGACTGRVVAMASPKAKGLQKPFNWGRVMRHELTHIFNLAQTDYQCPHWVTEGLAVQNERMQRSPQWSSILRDRFQSDTLLNLDTILLGFVRPKGPDEWTLAYCQSQIYVDYLVKTHGQESVGKVLNEYKSGKDTAAVLKAACGVEKAEFEKGYKAYVAEIVKAMGGKAPAVASQPEKPMTFEELQAAVEKTPDDLELKAKLAEQYLRRNMAGDAKKLSDAVLEKEPGHPLASMTKAKLLLRAGDDDAAKALLVAALKAKPDDAKLLALVGRFYIERKEYAEAAKLLEKGRLIAPLDGDWLEQLAKIYRELKDADKLQSVLTELVSHDPDELDGRIRLAKMNLDAGKPVTAEIFARDALLIDVNNAEAKDTLLEALKQQKKTVEIEKIEKRYK